MTSHERDWREINAQHTTTPTTPKSEKICEKNCPDFKGMEALHVEQCEDRCHSNSTQEFELRTEMNEIYRKIGEHLHSVPQHTSPEKEICYHTTHQSLKDCSKCGAPSFTEKTLSEFREKFPELQALTVVGMSAGYIDKRPAVEQWLSTKLSEAQKRLPTFLTDNEIADIKQEERTSILQIFNEVMDYFAPVDEHHLAIRDRFRTSLAEEIGN